MKLWAVIAVLALVPTAFAAKALGEQVFTDLGSGQSCASSPLQPFTSPLTGQLGGSVVGHLKNEGEAVAVRACVFDGSGAKRLDQEFVLSAGEARDVVLETPPGVYKLTAEFRAGRVSSAGSATMSTNWCATHANEVDIAGHAGPSGAGARVAGNSCVGGNLGTAALGILVSGTALVVGKLPHLGAFALYTRLKKPRVLDSSVRGRLHTLIAENPGIHTRELVRAIDGADGQVAYHLGVLSRERLLSSVGLPGMRHWFVAGRFSPARMTAVVSLRDPTRRRIYDAIVARPGGTLTDAARAAGVALAQGSRAARALERAGLVERRSVGRTLELRAVQAPMDVFGVREAASA